MADQKTRGTPRGSPKARKHGKRPGKAAKRRGTASASTSVTKSSGQTARDEAREHAASGSNGVQPTKLDATASTNTTPAPPAKPAAVRPSRASTAPRGGRRLKHSSSKRAYGGTTLGAESPCVSRSCPWSCRACRAVLLTTPSFSRACATDTLNKHQTTTPTRTGRRPTASAHPGAWTLDPTTALSDNHVAASALPPPTARATSHHGRGAPL